MNEPQEPDKSGDIAPAEGAEPSEAEVTSPTTEVVETSTVEPAPPPPPPPPPAAAAPQAPTVTATQKTSEERRALLANALQGQVAGGARIESQSDYQAVIVQGHRVNHLLHFFIGIFTLGLWWLVWIVIAITGGEKRQMATVDEFGNVYMQKV